MRTPRRTTHGFTLIELLVVIAIIAILAAILFPIFAEARNRARLAACISNVKQLALAVQMYMGDYEDTFPYPWSVHNKVDNHCAWGQQGFRVAAWSVGDNTPPEGRCVNAYIKSPQICHCPREKIQPAVQGLGDGVHSDWEMEGTSYVILTVIGIPYNWYHRVALGDRKLQAVKYPSQQIMLGERGIQDFWAYAQRPADWPGLGYRNHSRKGPWTVVAFVDGHADYILMQKGRWEGEYPTPGKTCDQAEWILVQPDWETRPPPW